MINKDKFKKNIFLLNLNNNIKLFYNKYLTSEKKIIKKQFEKRLNRKLNLKHPVLYNDKLQWLKLNWYDENATICADKYRVRNFVRERIGKEYLNELISVYDDVSEIDIDELPNAFVLKATHASGFNIVCKNKNKMNWKKEFKKMKGWLKFNYFYYSNEWVYKDIKPRIICEKYIEQEDNSELRDYRFFCFNGEPKFIAVDLSITNKDKTRRNLYDLDWKLMEEEIGYPKEENFTLKKPNKLEEMIDLSKKLSRDFPHARIDFYEIDNRVIFGEITFFHQSGMGQFRPIEFEKKAGDWLELP